VNFVLVFMGNDLRSIYIKVLGILISLLAVLLSFEFSVVVKVFYSPYFLLIVIFVLLCFLILGVRDSVSGAKKEFEEKIVEVEKNFGIEMKGYERKFEERFKIYDRLNRLEIKVFDGKKRSS